jgi:hypothetical protein
MSDRSLSEWAEEFKVLEIPQDRARVLRWSSIRAVDPAPVAAGHFGIKVFMAWDDQYWYVAAKVIDDTVRPVLSSSLFPYNGDCAELYFAGTDVDSEQDIHELVLAGPETRKAHFQLGIPPTSLDTPDTYLSDWRTDPAFKQQALGAGFAVRAWKSRQGWSAKLRIPLDAFEASVRDKITRGEPLRAALTYLDYNTEIASGPGADGFRPDNVFCLDSEEREVNVPRYMRRISFRRD